MRRDRERMMHCPAYNYPISPAENGLSPCHSSSLISPRSLHIHRNSTSQEMMRAASQHGDVVTFQNRRFVCTALSSAEIPEIVEMAASARETAPMLQSLCQILFSPWATPSALHNEKLDAVSLLCNMIVELEDRTVTYSGKSFGSSGAPIATGGGVHQSFLPPP